MASTPQPSAGHIEIRSNRAGQPRAYIAGTRVRVQDIYVHCEIHGQTADEIVDGFAHLTLAQVHAALSYYFDHREEILEELRQDREFVAHTKAQGGPGPLEKKLVEIEAGDDPLPS
jgi:uncharacterized protein (DUF433 family)